MENLALWPCLSTKVATEQGGTSAPTGEPALGAQGTALSAALGRNRSCLSPMSTLLPTKPCSHLYCTGGTMPSCTNRGSCHSSCLHRGLEQQPVTAHLTKQCTLVCAYFCMTRASRLAGSQCSSVLTVAIYPLGHSLHLSY